MGKNIFNNMNLTDNSYLFDNSFLAENKTEGAEQTVLLSSLDDFSNHPFNVETDTEDFKELVDSIKENGLIYPILVRPNGSRYEIISGHRRVAASKEAGLIEIPAIVRDMNVYEATVVMVHSNLYRPDISIMERAKAYRMCSDAEKHQGKEGGDTAEKLGAAVSDSRRKVYRYIRLSHLNDYLLRLVSDKKMTINIGIELSYLAEDTQKTLQEVMEEFSMFPNIEQASMLGERAKKGDIISKESIIAMLLGDEKKKDKKKNNVSFKTKDIKDYFAPNTDAERMTEVIMQLLEHYKAGTFDEFVK